MKIGSALLNFYINGSIHVALSCYALMHLTFHMFQIPADESSALFVFFGTIVGYNFVKYDALVRVQRIAMRIQLKFIAALSLFAFVMVGYYFFQLQRITQVLSIIILAFTLLYTLPFFPNKKNARNWAGVKIYIVSLCWVGATVVLPVINAEIPITTDFFLKCLQRFILVFVLILIFEIIDVENDDPHLQTVPQQIGVKRTKILGLLLLLPFYCFEFLKINFDKNQLIVNLIMVSVLSLFIIYAKANRSRYYSSFFVEAVPIFWWLLVVFFDLRMIQL
ncbi:hypothetical protein [Flavobacterium sp. TAB 87]|uniref:hypothetical protein n=1 Tax=Flavobacterium sp. TAB 87 TaxID=1729581 RepID=UPI00076C75EA|nr:hypothetical protein [Flavobacterium sp. TAB 87]KVV13876.1 prenyltransferase [Flavobacterium sp. TAB 87]